MASETVGIVLHGNSCKISQTYFPPIELNSEYKYGVALLGLYTYNNFPNIREGINNTVWFTDFSEKCTFATGIHDLKSIFENLQKFLNRQLEIRKSSEGAEGAEKINSADYKIKYHLDELTAKVVINSGFQINFDHPASMHKLFGFDQKTVIEPHVVTMGIYPASIQPFKSLNVSLNIARGSFFNQIQSNVIHSFVPDVDPFFKITINIANPLYYELNVSKIEYLELRLTDENDGLLDNMDEDITAVIHIARL